MIGWEMVSMEKEYFKHTFNMSATIEIYHT
jgi:hypothetical protein